MDIEEIWDTAVKTVEIESKSVDGALKRLDKNEFHKAVTTLLSAPCIAVTACGTSSSAAMKFAHQLCCLGHTSSFLSPTEAVHGGMGCIHIGDAVVVISKGGMSTELFPIVDIAKKRGAIVILLTENADSSLAQNVDVTLLVKSEKEADKFHVLATSSYAAAVAVLDSIICALVEIGEFNTNDFSVIHPHGAVGIKLNS